MAETPKKLSVKGFAKVRGMSAKTVRRLCHEGKIPDAENWGTEKRALFMIPEDAEIKKVSEETPQSAPSNVTIPLEERKIEINLKEYDKIHLKETSMSKSRQYWNYGYAGLRMRKTKNGRERYYGLLWAEENGKRVRKETPVMKHVRNREEAVLELEKLHQEYLEGRFNKEKRIQFKDLAEKYVSYAEGISKKSLGSDKSYLYQKGGLVDFFGSMWVYEITSFHVGDYKKLRKNGKVTNTINLHLSLLRRILNLAKRWKIKLGDEVQNIVNPEEHFDKVPERKRVLTEEEEKKLFPKLSLKLQQIVNIDLNTGMRKMELLSLEWTEVDFSKREILIVTEKSKTSKERRIPLNDEALRSFQIIKAENGSSKYIFPSNSKTEHMTDIQKPFKRALKEAKIEDLHFHDLRRTFATRLHNRGVPLYHIMLLLGHSDLKTTQRYIGLENEEDLSYAVSVLNRPKERSVEPGWNKEPMAILENSVSPTNYLS